VLLQCLFTGFSRKDGFMARIAEVELERLKAEVSVEQLVRAQ
jgi:hypothetical protein